MGLTWDWYGLKAAVANGAFRRCCITVSLLLTGVACGGSNGGSSSVATIGTTQATTPIIHTTPAQGGAQIVALSDTTQGASIYYTTDGSTPTAGSTPYFAPFLVASNLTLKAIAVAAGDSDSNVASQAFAPNIPSGTLVWSEEFSNSTSANAQPDPTVWTYDTGAGGWGNDELETYCGWNSNASPCDPNNPNVYVGTDGNLHIVARQPAAAVYTSARLKTQGLFSFTYGRVEARIQIPEGQGLWPAFWTLGSDIPSVSWPACGEQDIMEHIDSPSPDWVAGSIHGSGLNGSQQIFAPKGQTLGGWHVYGMIWSNGSVAYYLDDPSNIYATFTSSNMSGTWPFESDGGAFVLLNLAVGGNWPGSPDATTIFPSEMLVDYVRIYTN